MRADVVPHARGQEPLAPNVHRVGSTLQAYALHRGCNWHDCAASTGGQSEEDRPCKYALGGPGRLTLEADPRPAIGGGCGSAPPLDWPNLRGFDGTVGSSG